MSLLICFQRLYSCLVFLEFLLSIIIGVNPVLEAVPWFPDQYFSFLSLCYLHFLSYHFWFWKSNTETNSPCLNVAHTYTFFFFSELHWCPLLSGLHLLPSTLKEHSCHLSALTSWIIFSFLCNMFLIFKYFWIWILWFSICFATWINKHPLCKRRKIMA